MDAARRNFRWIVLAGLVLSWVVMVTVMAAEFRAVPAADVLQRHRMVQPPTAATFGVEVAASALALVFACLVLWPGWARLYRTRLLTTGAALALWFLLTPPLAITSVQRVHRSWLALTGLSLVALAGLSLLYAAITRIMGRAGAAGPPPD